jgi:hypothetical protein
MLKKIKHKIFKFFLKIFRIKGVVVFADREASTTFFNLNIMNAKETSESLSFLCQGFNLILNKIEDTFFALYATNPDLGIDLDSIKNFFIFLRDSKNFKKKE